MNQCRTIPCILLVVAWAFLFAAVRLEAQPRFDWVRNGSSSWGHQGFGVATGPDGSVVACGQFYYQMNLGVTNVFAYANSGHNDAFLVKYSRSGELIWARADGGYSTEAGRAVAIDAQNNIYQVGTFQGVAYFGGTNLTSVSGSEDTFLAKYASDGTPLWVLQAGGNSVDYPHSMAVDYETNLVVAGFFTGYIDFGGTNFSGIGGSDAFVAKYSPSGVLLWAVRLGGPSSEEAYSVGVLPSGDYVVSGHFGGVLQYGERCVIGAGNLDAFVARITTSGEISWVRSAGGGNTDVAEAVAVTSSGEIVVAGYYAGNAAFGTTNLPGFGSQDFFVAKYSGSGDLVWVRGYGGGSDEYAVSLVVDGSGNSFITGWFWGGPVQFPGTNITSSGGYDMFLARFNTAGDFIWVTKTASGNSEYGQAIAIDTPGHIFVAGRFAYYGVFGPTNINTPTDPGFYLAKYTRDLPFLSSQPASQVLTEGALLSLSVTVTGTPPFAYQWQFNGTNIPNATNDALSLPAITTNAAGAYSVIVSNYEGAVSSESATVQVHTFSGSLDTTGLAWSTGGDAPWFSQTNFAYLGPESARSGLITNNQQSWMETTVTGPARVYFHWKISSENGYDYLRFLVNGAEVTNTSGKIEWKAVTFLLPPGTNTLRWAYTKDESESVGQDAGWVDAVSVVYAPVIDTPPASLVVTAGMTAAFGAVISGSEPFVYQWQFNGTNLPGATGPTLSLPGVQPNSAGPYVLIASNDAGAAASSPAQLTVLVPPLLTSQPLSHTVSVGGNVTLRVSADGTGPFTYQWRRNGEILTGATGQTLMLTNLQPQDAGLYDVIVSSPMGTTLSEAARITLIGLAVRPVVTVNGVVGAPYRIEYQNDLNETNWLTLTNVVLGASPSHYVDFTAEGFPNRFYRVVPE